MTHRLFQLVASVDFPGAPPGPPIDPIFPHDEYRAPWLVEPLVFETASSRGGEVSCEESHPLSAEIQRVLWVVLNNSILFSEDLVFAGDIERISPDGLPWILVVESEDEWTALCLATNFLRRLPHIVLPYRQMMTRDIRTYRAALQYLHLGKTRRA